MDVRTTQYYALDRGLDGMSLLDDAIPASLPEQSTLVPPQLRYPAQLQQLLNKPDLGEFLANAFVLATGNAVLSGPSQFSAALENAKEELHALLSDTAAPLANGMGKTSPTSSGKAKAGDYGSERGERDTSDDNAYGNAKATSGSGPAPSRPKLSPRVERLVQRAGRVLERESLLRADLASYRAALLKG